MSPEMKIELELDYKRILRNSAQPVHLVAKLTAAAQPLTQRARPAAFTVVLDRSGSMDGAPLENAKKACCEVIKNLRPEDSFQPGRLRRFSSGRYPARTTH
jgi:Ca-activated chloride channel family protein